MAANDLHLTTLDSPFCFMCGESFGNGELKKTKHHCIPMYLKSYRNVIIPVHEKCHRKLNELYVCTTKKAKAPWPIKKVTNKVEGLMKSSDVFNKKIKQVYSDFIKEIEQVENQNANIYKQPCP